MRLVVDMQGAQSASRNRGIGRYCRSLVLAMAECGSHDIHLVLNGGFGDATEELRDFFAGVAATLQHLGLVRTRTADCRPAAR